MKPNNTTPLNRPVRSGAIARRAVSALMSTLVIATVCSARQVAAQPRFDALSVKPAPRELPPAGFHSTAQFTCSEKQLTIDPVQLMSPCISLRSLILDAYSLRSTDLSGDSGWISQDRFAVRASVIAPQDRAAMMGMLRQALVDEFKMAVVSSSVSDEVDELVVAPGGSLLKPLPQGDTVIRNDTSGDVRKVGFSNIPDLVEWLNQEGYFGASRPPAGASLTRTVVDGTHLTGSYNISLAIIGSYKVPNGGWNTPPTIDYSALMEKQLGLMLRRTTRVFPIIKIEHAEKPATAEN